MNQDERASQLSAMFDGELPAAECELLSRRLARDEQLRATWSRYAVIGATLRAEPLAQVRPDFARGVSAALAAGGAARAGVRRARTLRGAALGGAVAAGVAGVAIMLLRNGLPVQDEARTAYAPAVTRTALPVTATRVLAGGGLALRTGGVNTTNQGHELFSYVVPPLSSDTNMPMQSALADYVVAHGEVSNSLARGYVLTQVVSNELVQPAPSTVMADGKQ